MDDWKTSTLEQVGRLVTGKTPPTSDPSNYGGAIPFVTPTDMDGRRIINQTIRYLSERGASQVRSSYLSKPAVLVSCIGSDMGKAVITDRPCVTNQQINSIIVSDEVEFLFVYYNLSTRRSELRHLAGGAAQPILNKSEFGRLPILLPPRAQQYSIASILNALDEKIELIRRMNETLEGTARAIFNDWFLNFGPTLARMEGRAPYLAPEIWTLFPDGLDAEGAPKGWRFTILDEVLSELECGGRPRGGISSYTDGIPSVGAESIVGLGKFDYSKTRYVPPEFFNKMSKGHVQSRDVLLYKDGGRPGEFEPHLTLFGDDFPFETFAINEHVYRMRARPEFGQALLYFWLSSDLVMEEMRMKGTGVAIPGLNSTQVKSLTTLLPTSDVSHAFGELAEPIITKILANCNEARALAILRDFLLPKLISGEIRVKDAEKIAEVAA